MATRLDPIAVPRRADARPPEQLPLLAPDQRGGVPMQKDRPLAQAGRTACRGHGPRSQSRGGVPRVALRPLNTRKSRRSEGNSTSAPPPSAHRSMRWVARGAEADESVIVGTTRNGYCNAPQPAT